MYLVKMHGNERDNEVCNLKLVCCLLIKTEPPTQN